MNNGINEILCAHSENIEVIKDLIGNMKDGKCNLSPFIGAGLSVPIYKLWSAALSSIIQTYHLSETVRREVEDCLGKYDYEQAASVLSRALRGIRYSKALNRLFGEHLINDEKLKNMPVRLLPQLFNRTVITTNFDRILNRIYSHDNQITMQSSDEKKNQCIKDMLGFYLVKIHGDIEEGNLVFTKEEYEKCYGKDYDTDNVFFLQQLFASRTMLFLGCSLNVDRTFHLLKKISQKGKYPHFAFLEMKDDIESEEFLKREEELSDINIQCIWYPKGKHYLVEDFLQFLIDCHEVDIDLENIIDRGYKSNGGNITNRFYDIQRDALLQSKLTGITDKSVLGDILPESYIDPLIQVSEFRKIRFSEFMNDYSVSEGIALLSPPGMGKSTTLKSIIIKDYHESFRNVFFYYIEARNLISYADQASEDEDLCRKVIRDKYPWLEIPPNIQVILLIDSCDELSQMNRSQLVHSLKHMYKKKYTVWLGCRKDYYMRYYDSLFMEFINYKIDLCDWTEQDADVFIESVLQKNEYGDKVFIEEVKEDIHRMGRENPDITFIFKNPFYLTLYLFCIVNRNISDNIKKNIENAYELYELFYGKWFERHKVSNSNAQKIKKLHALVALELYTRKGEAIKLREIIDSADINSLCNRRAFLDLLRFPRQSNDGNRRVAELKIDRFWHESFGDYLIAFDLVSFFKRPPMQKILDKEDMHLVNIVNYDVNIFIKEAFRSLSAKESIDICKQLSALYTCLKAEPKEYYIKERWNLLYYVGRLSIKIQRERERLLQLQRKMLLEAFDYEEDSRVKRTIIISLMNIYDKRDLEVEDKIIEYLNSLKPDSEADIINRSIQLVYCGDVGYNEKLDVFVEFGDLNNFRDNNACSWNKTKAYIFDRLKKDDRVSMIYRLWDLKTLFLFYESRNWKDIEKKDASIIYDTKIDNDSVFSAHVIKLLREEKALLQSYMKKILSES